MKILYGGDKNQLKIVNPAPGYNIENIIKKDIPKNTHYTIVDKLEINTEFLDCCEYNLGVITYNIPKAKEIQKAKFRAARKPVLEKLDIEYIKALEIGDIQKQQKIIIKKQALRDITNIHLPNDLAGIMNTWPEILNLRS